MCEQENGMKAHLRVCPVQLGTAHTRPFGALLVRCTWDVERVFDRLLHRVVRVSARTRGWGGEEGEREEEEEEEEEEWRPICL